MSHPDDRSGNLPDSILNEPAPLAKAKAYVAPIQAALTIKYQYGSSIGYYSYEQMRGAFLAGHDAALERDK